MFLIQFEQQLQKNYLCARDNEKFEIAIFDIIRIYCIDRNINQKII